MAKKHVLETYSHLDSQSCFGCVDVEEAEAPDGDSAAAGPLTRPDPPPAATPAETGPLPPEPEPKPLGWIEIELVGADDAPVAGKRVELTLPDGKVVESKTDAAGVVRLARIPAGNCQVRFPELDDGLIEAL